MEVAKSQFLKEAPTHLGKGQYIRLQLAPLDCVVPGQLESFVEQCGSSLIVSTLLPYERCPTIMHFNVSFHGQNANGALGSSKFTSKSKFYFHCGFRRFHGQPVFSQPQGPSARKAKYLKEVEASATATLSLCCPTLCTPCSVLVFGKECKLLGCGKVLTADPNLLIIKCKKLMGHPARVHKRKAVVRNMFTDPDDVRWFKPVELVTAKKLKGHIIEPLGTHGAMKCVFSDVLEQSDKARGPKRHMKRLAAPKNWCLAKLGGIYAPHPSSGPHKIRECLPMILLLRNRLKYALTYDEAKMIAMQRLVKIDNKVRTDMMFPLGFQDVVSIEKAQSQYRILYDPKGRFIPHKIHPDEAKVSGAAELLMYVVRQYKLCSVKKLATGLRGIPYIVTHDGRTIRYVHPEIQVHDTIRLDLETGKVLDFLKFGVGQKVMITGGHNIGRVGTIVHHEKHPGSVDIIHVKDLAGHSFATRISNVFVVGSHEKFWITLPKQKGIRKNIIEEREERLQRA